MPPPPEARFSVERKLEISSLPRVQYAIDTCRARSRSKVFLVPVWRLSATSMPQAAIQLIQVRNLGSIFKPGLSRCGLQACNYLLRRRSSLYIYVGCELSPVFMQIYLKTWPLTMQLRREGAITFPRAANSLASRILLRCVRRPYLPLPSQPLA